MNYKKVCVMLVCCLIFFLFSVGGYGKQDKNLFSKDVIDMTKMSKIMVYSNLYNIMSEPDKHVGKKVIMEGTFSSFYDRQSNKKYYACLVQDAGACCTMGIQIVPAQKYMNSKKIPQEDAKITVTGTFDTYEENGITFCQLIDADIN